MGRIGEGKGKLSLESFPFPFPSPNPTPSSSKTFDVIESLFAGIFVWAERGGWWSFWEKAGCGSLLVETESHFFRWQREKREGKTTKACLPLLFSLGPQKKNIISESRRTSGGRVKPFTFPAVLRAFWGNSTQRAATPWPLGGLAGLTGSASDFSKTG